MKTNAAMMALLKTTNLHAPLHADLLQVAASGFESREGCYLLRSLVEKSPNAIRSRFTDCTGYECFVNSLHVEDYDERAPLAQSLLFLNHVFTTWRVAMPIHRLTGIVSVDECSVVVKVHVDRPGEAWLGVDLEAYEDPVMSIDSSDDVLREVQNLNTQ